jgi:hypothetical protein
MALNSFGNNIRQEYLLGVWLDMECNHGIKLTSPQQDCGNTHKKKNSNNSHQHKNEPNFSPLGVQCFHGCQSQKLSYSVEATQCKVQLGYSPGGHWSCSFYVPIYTFTYSHDNVTGMEILRNMPFNSEGGLLTAHTPTIDPAAALVTGTMSVDFETSNL